jgi:hypothetical protein
MQTPKRGRKPKPEADKVNKIIGVFFSENQLKRAGGRRAVQEIMNEAAKPIKV